ncbi:MAG: hypothetical protein IPM79_20890 [Polyangiaceae bacterium]|nr:hypothetical protein [Polyangiaceae bacterium]MBK8940006.1 hypothetical protein [Polyangiaceae bacterium]
MTSPTGVPQHGVRFELVLRTAGPGRAVYEGFARTGGLDLTLRVTSETESAKAELTASPRPDNADALERAAAALVRAATRAELEEGAPPPHKIVRWREVG